MARARAAQPAWEALGFEGRGRVLRRMQKWMVDNAERVIQTIVDESGKTYEDAAVVELSYGAGALRLLGQERAQVPGRREDPHHEPVRARAASCASATGRSASWA